MNKIQRVVDAAADLLDDLSLPRNEHDAIFDCVNLICEMRDMTVSELRPMNEAPRDGTEILAYHKEGKNLHPVAWKDWPWKENNRPHWGMRWSEEYTCQDGCYEGWIPYPAYSA